MTAFRHNHLPAIAFLLSLPPLLGQSCGNFSGLPTPNPSPSPTPVPTPLQPYALALADFNGDFALDIAAANFGDDSVSIFLNNGHGVFTTGGKLVAGDAPNGIAAADFNADGDVDLAVTSTATIGPAAVVFLGKGDGTFATGMAYASTAIGASIAAGDINADGRPDLIIPNTMEGTLSLLLNTGSGQFAIPVDLPAGNQPMAVAVVDLNHDGHADLAVADRGGNSLLVFRYNPAGGAFLPAVTFMAGISPSWIAAGDLDVDGDADLVITNEGQANETTTDTVSVMLNNGNGTFATARNYLAGVNPRCVAVGDFDGDGLPDLAVANYGVSTATSGAAVLLNNGAGSFAAPVLYPAGSGPQAVAIGDFNRDTAPDMVTANFLSSNLSLLPNDGEGGFGTPR